MFILFLFTSGEVIWSFGLKNEKSSFQVKIRNTVIPSSKPSIHLHYVELDGRAFGVDCPSSINVIGGFEQGTKIKHKKHLLTPHLTQYLFKMI